MARNGRKARRLVIGEQTFLWSVRHDDRNGCAELLVIRPRGAHGRLVIAFRAGAGRLIPDGYLESGAVGLTEGGFLNLHEPGTARALLDAARSNGWRPDDPSTVELDGWALFEAAAAQRRTSAG